MGATERGAIDMPMFAWSRYRYCTVIGGQNGEIAELDEREPFRFRNETDNRYHRAQSGDTWWSIAAKFFSGVPRACGLWWLLCEYQPDPVVDPTLAIDDGTLIVIPSMRVLRMYAFSDERRRFH